VSLRYSTGDPGRKINLCCDWRLDEIVNQDPALLSTDAQIDLNNCDHEPIHIPSSIEPHGMLIAARNSDLTIVYVSENSTEMLGLPPDYLLGRGLKEILGAEAVASIDQSLGQEQHFPTNILTFDFPVRRGFRFDVFPHRSGTWHHYIQKHQVWHIAGSRLQGGHTIGRKHDLVVFLQGAGRKCYVEILIIDQQNARSPP
jgi:PAS domain-containing protein